MSKTNPEISVDKNDPNHSNIVQYAKSAANNHSKAANLQTQVKKDKIRIANEAKSIRKESCSDGFYAGLIRITDDELPPVRVEFRNNGKCLDVSQEQELDRLFGASRPLLFNREKVVTEILDPEKLIKDLRAMGKNPWDFIKVDIKKGQDSVVAENTDAVTSDEGFVAHKGLLDTMNNIYDTLSDEARKFIDDYLEHTLDSKVVLGTKG